MKAKSKRPTKIWLFIKVASLLAAGAPPEIVKRASPADQLRLHLIGISAVIPALLAFLTGGLAFLMFVPGAYLLAWLVVAPIALFLILLIEVVVNASLSPALPMDQKMKLGAIRIVFSFVLSVTIALPLKLALFEGPVLAELQQMRQEADDEMRRKLEQKLEGVDGQIKEAGRRLDARNADCGRLLDALNAEIDGEKGGRSAGFGKIAEIKEGQLLKCEGEREVLRREIGALKLEQESIEAEIIADASRRTAVAKELVRDDLMSRLQAYTRLAEKNPFLGVAGFFIFLLLTGVDTIPTVVKVFARLDSYKIAEKQAELEAKAHMKAQLLANPHIARARAHELVAREHQKQLLKARLRRTWARLRMMDLEYDERSAVEQKQARNSLYEDSDFTSVLRKYDQQMIDLDNHTPNTTPNNPKNNKPDGEGNTPASSTSEGVHIHRTHPNTRRFKRDRRPQRASQKHYQKKDLL